MGGVYGPKQPQPVVLRLRIDGCTPLDLLRISEHLTPTTEAPSSSQSFRELPQREVRDGLCTSPVWPSTGAPAPSDRARTAGEGMPCSRGYYGFLCEHKRRPRLWPPCPARGRIGHRTAAKR